MIQRRRALVAPKHGGLKFCVAAGVLDQVVTPHEPLVAERALEALLAGMCARVTSQLIGTSELLLTVRPCARERPLSCVGPDVCLQVGRFAVNPVASLISALVSLDRGPRGPHASRPHPPRWVLLSRNWGGGWGHGRGGRVGQRGVAALASARGVAAFRVGRHGAKLAV